MKTGVIITADLSDKRGEEIFETVHVNHVFIPNSGDWRKSNNENKVDPEDVKHYIELMAEGVACCIDFLNSKQVDSHANLLQSVKDKIDKAFFRAMKLEESKNPNQNDIRGTNVISSNSQS